MKLLSEELEKTPFHIHGKPVKFISYRAQRDATAFLQHIYSHCNGLGLFTGPPLSGKSTTIRHFVEELPQDSLSAIIDGGRHDVTSLLCNILKQFGYEVDWPSINIMMNMVKVVAAQQTSLNHAPLLVIENFNAMNPNTIHLVCQLAKLNVHKQSALKIVLVSDQSLGRMMVAPALTEIANRKTGEHELGGMTLPETTYYLDAKLRHAGIKKPESVISVGVCEELFEETAGRPGCIDKCMLKRMGAADSLPLVPEHQVIAGAEGQEIDEKAPVENELPVLEDMISLDEMLKAGDPDAAQDEFPQLAVSINGRTIGIFTLDRPRLMIGRSEHNDITISSSFISRHHAVLVRQAGVMTIMDLNSRNGSFVNSKRITSQPLMHDDVILLGSHRLKLQDPANCRRVQADAADLQDTVTMKSLGDERRRIAQAYMRRNRA